MSDEELRMQASIAAKMRRSGALGAGGKKTKKKKVDPEELVGDLTEEEMKYQIDMQIKMLKTEPAKFRDMIRAQDPASYAQIAALTDDQLIQQLETQKSLDPSTIKEMRAMQMEAKRTGASGGGLGCEWGRLLLGRPHLGERHLLNGPGAGTEDDEDPVQHIQKGPREVSPGGAAVRRDPGHAHRVDAAHVCGDRSRADAAVLHVGAIR